MATTTEILIAGAMAALITLPGCARESDRSMVRSDRAIAQSDRVAPDPRAIPYVAARSATFGENVFTIGVAQTIPELLPNRLIDAWGGVPVVNSQTVIVGTPTDVRPEHASVWGVGDDEHPDGETKVGFDDPKSMSRTWLVEVTVDDLIAGQPPSKALAGAEDNGITLRFKSTGGPIDVDTFRAGVLGFGRSVWFLTAYPEEPKDAFGLAWNGGAVATIGADGSLSFPMMTPTRRRELKEETFTVDLLRKLGAETDTHVARPGGTGG